MCCSKTTEPVGANKIETFTKLRKYQQFSKLIFVFVSLFLFCSSVAPVTITIIKLVVMCELKASAINSVADTRIFQPVTVLVQHS